MVNNADWLLKLLYVDFLRDIGRHFSVNQMLPPRPTTPRSERGLTFLEFNYMLLQAYDFLHLHRSTAAGSSSAAATSGPTSLPAPT